MSIAADPRATSPGGAPAAQGAERPRRSPSLKLGIPFVALHLAVVGVAFVGFSEAALVALVCSYVLRAFGITAFYHRCFAHRAFRVSRPVQFGGAMLGAAAAQRGPLWWVAHHREHHRKTDVVGDPHSPVIDGFWYSHVLWIFEPQNQATDLARVRDLARFKELRLIDRFEHAVPVVLGAAMFAIGSLLGHLDPDTHTSGLQLLEWGFVVPTIVLYHSTFAVNSLAHRFGRRPFDTPDASRNNWFISLMVLGEGWHNNHHRYPASARQGIGRFEPDPTWWGIRLLEHLHLASALRPLPESVVTEHGLPRRENRADPGPLQRAEIASSTRTSPSPVEPVK